MKKTMITIAMAACMCAAYAQQDVNDQKQKDKTTTKKKTDGTVKSKISAVTGENNKDEKFVKTILDGGMLEVKLGELAQKNSASAEIKSFAETMVTEHTKAGNELKTLANKKGIPVAESLSAKSQNKYDELAKKQGKDFDKDYRDFMVKDHKSAEADFKKEADKGMDADIKDWASKTLPTIQHHLQMAENLNKVAKKD